MLAVPKVELDYHCNYGYQNAVAAIQNLEVSKFGNAHKPEQAMEV